MPLPARLPAERQRPVSGRGDTISDADEGKKYAGFQTDTLRNVGRSSFEGIASTQVISACFFSELQLQ